MIQVDRMREVGRIIKVGRIEVGRIEVGRMI